MIAMLEEGMQPFEIRAAIDRTFAAQIDHATPTPYPPRDMTWG